MKQLTPDNLFERDERMDFWSVWGLGPANHPNEQWFAWFLAPRLPPSVPDEIIELFDRVKAIACYATCHYPLFVVAGDELFRAKDAALLIACRQRGAPKRRTKTYADRIAWAAEDGLIDQSDVVRWEAGRRLRNDGAHRTDPSLYGPNDVRSMLETSAGRIADLFERLRKVNAGAAAPPSSSACERFGRTILTDE